MRDNYYQVDTQEKAMITLEDMAADIVKTGSNPLGEEDEGKFEALMMGIIAIGFSDKAELETRFANGVMFIYRDVMAYVEAQRGI